MRRAGEITLERRHGIGHCPDTVEVLGGLFDGGFVGRHPDAVFHDFSGHLRVFVLESQLFYIAAFLAGFQAVGAGIVQKPHIFSALDHTEEIVCPDRILVFVCRESEAFPEFRRDERRAHAPAREDAFVAGQDNEVREVHRPGFERAHDLEALQRLALERNRNTTYKLLQQTDIRHRKNGQGLRFQTVDGEVILLGEMCLQGHAFHAGNLRSDFTEEFQLI